MSSPTCPVAMPGATQTLDGHMYTLEGEDTFTKDAPPGSFAQSSTGVPDANSLPVVYSGDHGMGWTEYPDGWSSTHSNGLEGYLPSTVQSVHDGMLDFYLHVDPNTGLPVGASPSPLPGGNRYQTYGAWSFCERIAPDNDSHDLVDFHQATLLWPKADSDWQQAESDYPEADLNASPTVDAMNQWSAYAHNTVDGQDYYRIAQTEPNFDPTRWHVYTQTWGPGFRSYYVDGNLVGTSTSGVWPNPERWQLQIEPSMVGGAGSGHVYVKWVWIGTY